MHFQLFKPSSILSQYIKYYWVLEANSNEGEICERVIPTENIELMFHYQNPFLMKHNNILTKQPQSLISGINNSYKDVSTNGCSGVIAVSFYPLGACNFFDFPLIEIENNVINLDDIYKEKVCSIEEQILSAKTLQQRINIIEKYLLKKLKPVHHSDTTLIDKSLSLINQSKGQISAVNVSEKLSISTKKMERKFSTLIGKTPKQYIKIIRLHEVIKSLSNSRSKYFTELAYENGYFDQAHFIKDFKDLSGYTPKEFVSKYPCLSTQ